MKQTLFLLGFLAIAGISNAQKAPKNALKVNPLSLLVKTGNFSYERAVADKQSVQLGGFYSSLSFDETNYAGFGITPEYRFYIGANSTALNGVYAAPFGRFQRYSLSQKGSGNKAAFTSVGGGATVGWQKSWESGLVLNLFAGPSFSEIKFTNGKQDEFDIKPSFKGFGMRSGISIGITF